MNAASRSGRQEQEHIHQTWEGKFSLPLYMQARKNAPIILAVGGSKTFCLCLNLNSASICRIHLTFKEDYCRALCSKRILLSLRRFGDESDFLEWDILKVERLRD